MSGCPSMYGLGLLRMAVRSHSLLDGIQRENRPGQDTEASFDNRADGCLEAAIQDTRVSICTAPVRFGRAETGTSDVHCSALNTLDPFGQVQLKR